MTSEGGFRTPEQEVVRLLEDCADLKRMLQSIAGQISRMEARVKKAFPQEAELVQERRKTSSNLANPSMSREEALAEFEKVVRLASSGNASDAERLLHDRSPADLLMIARELGVTFPKSKPSARAMRDAIFGKVRESILLSRHSPRG